MKENKVQKHEERRRNLTFCDREVPMLPMMELECRERLQIRVSKCSSESDQNESESVESERFQRS